MRISSCCCQLKQEAFFSQLSVSDEHDVMGVDPADMLTISCCSEGQLGAQDRGRSSGGSVAVRLLVMLLVC